ncbi:hypothetical protein KKF70_02520 [bacterium]|nr:hypothetical protein [Candidatus Omnitrophota bacterium]MBU2528247.1 hypothetical protein [bacterium]MBU3929625.1 hypothetical protein [bacterium]MBU4122194.1 hypothetical protein [bacterium]
MKCLTAGHRGAKALAPENTLKAFRIGFEKADAVECDVRLTKDGFLAVIHDGYLARTASRPGKVKDFTMAELAAFDAGDGEKIPALEDVIKLAAAFSKTLIIEIKTDRGDSSEAPALALQKTFSSFENLPGIMVCSFNHKTLKNVRKIMPEIKIIATMKKGMSEAEIEKALDDLSPEGVSVELRGLTPALAAKIKAGGMFLQAWVVNEDKDFRTMEAMGVDWVYTDFPGKFGR